jgi:hypothetical protein
VVSTHCYRCYDGFGRWPDNHRGYTIAELTEAFTDEFLPVAQTYPLIIGEIGADIGASDYTNEIAAFRNAFDILGQNGVHYLAFWWFPQGPRALLSGQPNYAPTDAGLQLIQAIQTLPPPPAEYTLTITAATGGTTSPAPGSYSYTEGASVTVTAIPDPGYKFANWLLDGAANTENPITITMDTDHTLEAVFEYVPPPPLTATIKGVITDKTTGSPVPAATVTCDGYADITEADGSYVFENIPAQKYTLKVAKEGYVEAALSIDASAGGTAIIDIPISPAPKAPVFKIPITPLPLIVGAIITYLGQKKG